MLSYYFILAAPMLFGLSFICFIRPFGWLRVFPLMAALVGVLMWRRREQWLAIALAAWAALTYLLDLLAWWLSVGDLQPERARLTWVGLPSQAVAGFPWHALELPPGAMGGDLPTAEQWLIVMTNLGFWGVIAGVAVFAAAHRRPANRTRLLTMPWLLLAAALAFNQMLMATFMLWFD